MGDSLLPVSPSYQSFESNLRSAVGRNDSPSNVVNSTFIEGDKQNQLTSSTRQFQVALSNRNGQCNGKRKLIKPPLPYRCQECGKEFKKIENLRTHLMNHLLQPKAKGENAVPPFACQMQGCTKQFATKQDQRRHESRHNQPSNFHCERYVIF